METLLQRGQQLIRDATPPRRRLDATVWLSIRGQTLLAIALGALAVSALSLLLAGWGFDDPYITYRYAHNLRTGQGLVYNAGQRTLSTTTPLYAVMLAGLSTLWSDLPTLSSVLSALALVLTAGLFVAWTQHRSQPAVGRVAAVLLVVSPLLLMTFGLETCLYLLSILAGFYAYDRDRLPLAAVTLALAAGLRPDGLLAALALAACHLLRRRPIPWQPALLYVALVSAWYAGLWLYFGSPIPVSLAAKQHQGQMALSTRFLPGLGEMVCAYARQPLYWLHAALAGLGLVRVATGARHWLPLLLWTALYLVAYSLLGVSRYVWYYAPLVPATVVLVAEGAVDVLRRLAGTKLPRPLPTAAAGLLLIALLAPLVQGATLIAWRADLRLEVHRQAGQWLAANTPPEATVGTLEVGVVGYYAQRPIVGFAGLLQPEVAAQLTSTATYQDAAFWAIQAYRPDYVLLRRDGFPELTTSDWFQDAYRPVRDFASGGPLWLTAYQRSDGP